MEDTEDVEILTALQTPDIVTNVAGKSCGDLYGKPPTSPVKHHICKEMS